MTDPRVGERVEIQGFAIPAAAGPTVHTDDGQSYYLGGARDWGTDMIGKRIVVSGTLRLRPPQVETRPPDEDQEHGLTDETLVIDDAQWRPAE